MQHVEAEEQGNAQARLFHRELLKAPGRLAAPKVQHGPNLAGANALCRFVAAESGR